MCTDQQVKEVDDELQMKRKVKSWQASKLDSVSHVLHDLRKRGKSLAFMCAFLSKFEAIEVHKSTVCRYFERQKKSGVMK